MLTKNNYIDGIKCEKKMKLDILNKPVISAEILENAQEFRELVQSTYHNLIFLNDKLPVSERIAESKKYLKLDADMLGNVTLKSSNMLVNIDILEKTKSGYNIYDIKSSTTEKEDYINELAYNYYVASHVLKINNIYLVQPKKIEVKKRYNSRDMIVVKNKTNEIKEIMNTVAIKTYLLKEALENDDYHYEVSTKCKSNSIECPYFHECVNIKRGNIFDMSGIPFETKIEYYNKGIITKKDILENGELKVKKEELKDTITIHKKEIKEFLKTIIYPVSYLDFETVSFLVPRYFNHTVNSKIAIQYSLHIKDTSLTHHYAIFKALTDPRRKLAEKLVEDTPKTGSVIVYHASFESSILTSLAELYKDLSADLLSIKERLVDLEFIFKNKYYYDPLFYGSSSIKVVLPTLFPDDDELNYNKFKHVHNGLQAASYLRQDDYTDEIKEDLLEYCKLDTLAMVKIHEFLEKTVKE